MSKLIYLSGVRYQKRGYLGRKIQRRHEVVFWGGENVLYLDRSVG